MLSSDLKMALDASIWAQESFDLALDPWQISALQSTKKRSIWLIHRQGGKSSIAALKALHRMIYAPGSLVLIISPSERQSLETYRKWGVYYDRLNDKPGLVEDRALGCVLDNHSRLEALPGIEGTIRSFSAVSLIIEDEAAAVPDELFDAIRPMTAVSNGAILLMSTPRGARGHFYNIFADGGPEWERVKVTAPECTRISPEFLDQERRSMPADSYAAEYMCEFRSSEDNSVFNYEDISATIDDSIEPLVI